MNNLLFIKDLLKLRANKLCRYAAVIGQSHYELMCRFEALRSYKEKGLQGEKEFYSYCRDHLTEYLFTCLENGKVPSICAALLHSSLQDFYSVIEYAEGNSDEAQ